MDAQQIWLERAISRDVTSISFSGGPRGGSDANPIMKNGAARTVA
jgi:hypothetical protein